MPQQWLGAALGAAGGALGMINQRKRENRQFNNQKKLMNLQFGNQQALNQQGADLAYQNWLKTQSPQARKKQFEESGLSMGLMYGGTGNVSGGTTPMGGGGNAASGQAPDPRFMDVGAIAQSAMTAANIKLAESQAKKNEAEAEKISGVDTDAVTQNIEKMKAETKHEFVKTTLTQAEKYLKDVQYDKTMQESILASLETSIKEKTYWEQIEGIKAATVNVLLDNALKESNTELNEAQRKAALEGITQRWWEIGVKGVGTVINGVLGSAAVKGLSKKPKTDSSGKYYKYEY